MTWFPHFMNWLPALAAAAVAVPALLILYFLKLRRREMAVSSTLLWKKAIQDLQVNAPFQKLRRNLLLLLQLLLLLLLILALSRPVTNYQPGAGALTVILIDRSASMSAKDMNGHTRLEEAKRRAKELVDSMKRNATAMVIAFDETAETLQGFTSDAVALRSAIDSVKPTDRRSRLKLAYELADATMNFNPDQLRSNAPKPDVRLYSDGRVLDANDISIRGNLIFERIGNDSAQNVGIVALSAKRNYERPTQVEVFARLANFGPEPVEAPVQLTVDGEVIETDSGRTKSTFLYPERWSKDQRDAWQAKNGRPAGDSITFQLDLAHSAVIKLEQMHRSGDVLAADDVAQVIVPPPKALAVLLVTDGNPFLEKVLKVQGLQQFELMTPNDYEQKQPTNFDVIFFDRYRPEKLPPAGSFIYSGVVPPGIKVTAAQDEQKNDVLLHDIGVLDWMRDHPILRQISMGKLYVQDALKLNVPPESEVLIDGLKGPLLVLHREGKRVHLIFAFDLLQSNLPLRTTFPVFIYNALQYLAIGSEMDVRQSFEPGSTPRIPRGNLQRVDPNLKKLVLKGPGGSQTLAIPESGDFALPPLDLVGVYSTEPPVPQFEQMAVNLLDANESNVLAATNAPGDAEAKVVGIENQKARREWWWYIIAFAALPLLFIEWWVYTRRVYL